MPEESPGSPATADGLGTTGNLNDAEMRDGTERTAAADAAAKEEAAFVPTNLGAFPFEEHVPSKPAVESAAAVEATTERDKFEWERSRRDRRRPRTDWDLLEI